MFTCIRLFVFGLLLPLLALQAKPETTRIEFYYGIAQGNYLIGDLEGASRGVQQMLKVDPDYVPALTLNARILLDQNKSDLALEFAERATKLKPDDLEHQLLKALVLGNLNRRKEAIHVVETVIQSAPAKSRQHRVASKLLGLFLMAEGDPDKAAEVLNQSYLHDPESAQANRALAGEAYLQQADQALNQSDFNTAIKAIDQALTLLKGQSGDSNFQRRSQLNMLRARILAQAGRLNEAIAILQVIANQQPDNMEALVTLASLYAGAGKWNLLQNILPDIAKKPELQDIALYLEGRIALANNRVGSAREAFEQALRVLPDGNSKLRAALQFYQGVCWLKKGHMEDGDRMIIQSINNKFRPETEAEVILVGRVLMRAGRIQQAIVFLEAVTLNQLTASAEAWNLLGRAHQRDDSTALALSSFNQSISIQPDQSDALAFRGSLLRKIGDLRGAAADLEAALGLDPENAALSFSLGLTCLQLGQLDDARRWIGESAHKLRGHPGIYLLHALLAHNTEANETANRALKTYFSQVPEQTNETAFYLEHIQLARENPDLAGNKLKQRIEASKASSLLRNFHAYTQGSLDRKAVLDAAGHAKKTEIAQRQLCETAYWLGEYERVCNQTETAKELFKLAIQIGSPDYPEYQFAKWQLR